MKKAIIILICVNCLFLISCGKDGALGPAGTQGSTGPQGPTGSSGAGTRIVYIGTFPIAHATMNIPGLDLNDMPMIKIYVYMTPSDPYYGAVWVDCTTSFTFGADTIYHSNTLFDGKSYKIVVIK